MYIYFLASNVEDTQSGNPRYIWESAKKSDITKKSWDSLQQSITEDDRIFIIDSDLTDKQVQNLEDSARGLVTHIKVPKTKDKRQYLTTALETIEDNLDYSRGHFLLEDDYLFVYDALVILNQCLDHWSGFVVPDDAPEKYVTPYESQVFVGTDRHWRTTKEATWCVMANAPTWKYYIKLLKENAKSNNYNIFRNNILQQVPCICPLPGVATHLKDGHISPLIDWAEVWKGIAK